MKKGVAVVFSMFVTLTFLVSGCAGESAPAAQKKTYSGKEGRITAYISGPEQMLADVEKAFEQERGDVLEVLAMGSGPLA